MDRASGKGEGVGDNTHGGETIASLYQSTTHPGILRRIIWTSFSQRVDIMNSQMADLLFSAPQENDTCKQSYKGFLRHGNDTKYKVAKFIARLATFQLDYFECPTTQVPTGDSRIVDREDKSDCRILYASTEQVEAAKIGKGLPDFSYLLVPYHDASHRWMHQFEPWLTPQQNPECPTDNSRPYATSALSDGKSTPAVSVSAIIITPVQTLTSLLISSTSERLLLLSSLSHVYNSNSVIPDTSHNPGLSKGAIAETTIGAAALLTLLLLAF